MKYIQKDILSVTRGIICQQVNCQRAMGAGLAFQIRHKWPIVYQLYQMVEPSLGLCQIVCVGPALYVANLFGQYDFGNSGRYTNYLALQDAFRELAHHLDRDKTLPVYIPYRLGCGRAGGDWDRVSQLVQRFFPEAYICSLDPVAV